MYLACGRYQYIYNPHTEEIFPKKIALKNFYHPFKPHLWLILDLTSIFFFLYLSRLITQTHISRDPSHNYTEALLSAYVESNFE